jgi:hypothetical protein
MSDKPKSPGLLLWAIGAVVVGVALYPLSFDMSTALKALSLAFITFCVWMRLRGYVVELIVAVVLVMMLIALTLPSVAARYYVVHERPRRQAQ